MKKSTFAARLVEGLDTVGMTAADLSRKTKIPEGTISCYKSGKYEAKQDKVYIIAKALNVDPSWLMGYDVPMQPDSFIPEGFEPVPELVPVPVVGRIACGTPILAEQNIDGVICIPARWRADFILICDGDSMEPKIHKGDLVAIRRQPEVENGEIAAVRIGEEATLKRVYRHDKFLELRPENPGFPSLIYAGEGMEDVTIEGKAMGLCRDL